MGCEIHSHLAMYISSPPLGQSNPLSTLKGTNDTLEYGCNVSEVGKTATDDGKFASEQLEGIPKLTYGTS